MYKYNKIIKADNHGQFSLLEIQHGGRCVLSGIFFSGNVKIQRLSFLKAMQIIMVYNHVQSSLRLRSAEFMGEREDFFFFINVY